MPEKLESGNETVEKSLINHLTPEYLVAEAFRLPYLGHSPLQLFNSLATGNWKLN